MSTKITQREAPDAIRNREPFQASALSAVCGRVETTGDLPDEWKCKYHDGDPVYTVLSYSTPIAWVSASGEVTLPGLRYSLTTTQHQHTAARALGLSLYSDEPDEGRAVPADHYGARMGW